MVGRRESESDVSEIQPLLSFQVPCFFSFYFTFVCGSNVCTYFETRAINPVLQ